MKRTDLLIMLAAIYAAPHINEAIGLVIAGLAFLAAILIHWKE